MASARQRRPVARARLRRHAPAVDRPRRGARRSRRARARRVAARLRRRRRWAPSSPASRSRRASAASSAARSPIAAGTSPASSATSGPPPRRASCSDSTPGQLAHALGIAGTQAAGLEQSFGTMSKPLHPGKAAMNGLLAALLAARGVHRRDRRCSTGRAGSPATFLGITDLALPSRTSASDSRSSRTAPSPTPPVI